MTTVDRNYEPMVVADDDDLGSNRSSNRPLLEIAQERLSRRTVMKAFVTTAVAGTFGTTLTSRIALAAAENDPSTLTFAPLDQVIGDDHQVASGYSADVLIRWGDKVLADAPEWDPNAQTGAAQAKQFGYNCDFMGYFPLPKGGRQFRAWPAARQSRVHRRPTDVPWLDR